MGPAGWRAGAAEAVGETAGASAWAQPKRQAAASPKTSAVTHEATHGGIASLIVDRSAVQEVVCVVMGTRVIQAEACPAAVDRDRPGRHAPQLLGEELIGTCGHLFSAPARVSYSVAPLPRSRHRQSPGIELRGYAK